MPDDTASTWNPGTDPVIEMRHVHVIHKSRTGRLFRPDTVHAVNDILFAATRGYSDLNLAESDTLVDGVFGCSTEC